MANEGDPKQPSRCLARSNVGIWRAISDSTRHLLRMSSKHLEIHSERVLDGRYKNLPILFRFLSAKSEKLKSFKGELSSWKVSSLGRATARSLANLYIELERF